MGVARQDQRTLERIAATLVAMAALAERAGSLSFPVRWLVLTILWSAEAVARTFVLETTRSMHFHPPVEIAGLTHMRIFPPHPAASRPPSPRWGEEGASVSAAPSPLGERTRGDSRAGEGAYAVASLVTGSSPADAAWLALRFRALAAALGALLLFLCRFGRPNAELGGATCRLAPGRHWLAALPGGWEPARVDSS